MSVPMLGIVSAIVGTTVAICLVPDDPSPKGALFYSGLVMAIGLAVAPAAGAYRDLKSIVRAEHVLVLAPIYWLLLDLLQKAYDLEQIGRAEVIKSFLAIGVFVSAVWVGVWHRPWRLPRSLQRATSYQVKPEVFFVLVILSFVLGMLKFAYACDFSPMEMLTYLGSDRWSAPWSRGALGGWDAFLDHTAYFGYLLPACAVVMANKSGWLSMRTLLTLLLAVIFALFIAQGGSRRNIGVMFGIALLLWMHTQRRLQTRNVAIVAACGVGLLFALQLILEYRNVGLAAVVDKESEVEVQKVGYVHVDDNFYRLAQIVQLIPASHPYTWFQYLAYVLVRPIPRVLWPGKPIGPGFDLAEALRMPGVSLSSSVMGELFVSGGFLAVLIGGWLYGRLASAGDSLISAGTVGAQVAYCAWTMALFTGVRSMLDLVLFTYVILAWIGLVWLVRLLDPVAAAPVSSRAARLGRLTARSRGYNGGVVRRPGRVARPAAR